MSVSGTSARHTYVPVAHYERRECAQIVFIPDKPADHNVAIVFWT